MLIVARQSLYERLQSITQAYDSDGTQSTKDPHKFDKLAEIDSEIRNRMVYYTEVWEEVFNTIQKLEDGRYRQILVGRYLRGFTWERIAVAIGYSYKQTIRLHGYALKAIEQFITEEKYD